jgi:hypothetical protein
LKKIIILMSLLTPFLAMGGVKVYHVELTGQDSSARGLATVVVNQAAAKLSITLSHNVEGATASVIRNEGGDVAFPLESAAKVAHSQWDIADMDIAALAEAGLTVAVMSENYPEGAISAKLEGPEDAIEYEVTITNLTAGQPLSPALIATHEPGISLYTLGQPCPEAFIPLVEDGLNDDGTAYAMSLGVFDVTNASGPLPPGGSVTLSVCGTATASRISLMSMLVNTNDAFIALDGFKAPPAPYAFKNAGPLIPTLTTMPNVYDAGTEINNENCDYIPGPYCNMNVGVRDPENGVILSHNGIHDIYHLDSVLHDWRGPVALISITRAD